MEDTKVPVAEPSAATDSYLGDAFKQFNERVNPSAKTETKPEKDAEPGAAATSEKTKPEEKSKTAAEPGAAPKQEQNQDKDKPSADERIARLTAELKELRERTLKPETPRADAKAEPAKEPPKRPNALKWTGTAEEYEKAMDEWDAYQRQVAIAEGEQRAKQQATVQEVEKKLEDARKKYADADTRIFPTNDRLIEAKLPNAIYAMINRSDVMVDLLYTLGEPEKLKQFIKTAHADPGAAIEEIVVLQSLIRQELGKSSKKEEAKPEAKAEDKKEPPARPEPRAPEPPKEVGGRGTTPTDELEDAVRNDDYLRAKREQERRYFSASK